MAGNRSQATVTEGVTEAWKGFFLHQFLHFRENNLAQSTQDAFSLSLPGLVQEVRLETLLSGPPYTWCGHWSQHWDLASGASCKAFGWCFSLVPSWNLDTVAGSPAATLQS